MGRFRIWLGGFAWGVLIGVGVATFVGVALTRPDLLERFTQSTDSTLRQGAAALRSAPPPTVPAPPPTPAPAPVAVPAAVPAAGPTGPVWLARTRTVATLEEEFYPPLRWAADQELVIRGRNGETAPVVLNIRVDDAKSRNWNTRFNAERPVAAGPFEIRLPLDGLVTPDKAPLDLGAIQRIVLFTRSDQPLDIDGVRLAPRAAVNGGAAAGASPAPGTQPATTAPVWFAGGRTVPALEQEFYPAARWGAGQELVIRGRNAGTGPVELSLRIDDVQSKDWSSRFNDVRQVGPGPFEVRLPVSALDTPGRSRLDFGAIQRIVLFTPPDLPPLDITGARLEGAAAPAPAAAPGPAPASAGGDQASNGPIWFPGGRTTETLEQEFYPPARWSPDQELAIRGRNAGTGPVELSIRIDDVRSKDWNSRFNDVRQVAPGPFEIRLPASALDIPAGGRLDLGAIARIVLFTPKDQPPLDVEGIALAPRGAAVVPPPAPAPAPASVSAAPPPAAVPPPPPGKAGGLERNWLNGARTTAIQDFTDPVAFAADEEVVVTGTNSSGKPITVHLRIDDVNSKDWYSRGGTSATVGPGRFILRSPVSSWVTPAKTRLDRTRIRRLVVFVGEGDAPATLDGVRVGQGNPVPPDALALRFSPNADIAVPGFETVLPNDPRLTGGAAGSLIRTANDPLLSSGLNGIRTVTVPWTKSDVATVSLWTEDQGEWEYFPHSLDRTITINGVRVLADRYQPSQWIHEVYRRGLWQEAMIDGDPWAVYARRRAGLVTATVPVVDGKIVVSIDADQPPNNGYLAAMVVEPGDSHKAVDAIEAWRRVRYLERWPVMDRPVDPALARGLSLRALPPGGPRSLHPSWDDNLPVTTRFRAPRGAIVSVDFLALSDRSDDAPEVTLDLPEGVTGEVRWGKWTYMRRGVGQNALAVTADVLEGDLSRLRIAKGVPRRLTVTLDVPEIFSGELVATLTLKAAGDTMQAGFVVDVLPLTLPPTATPVGFYMLAPNYDLWFPPPEAEADRLMACDYRTLRRFGITGVSPATVAPFPEQRERYVQQMRLVAEAGFSTPYFDYASVKDIAGRLGAEEMGRDVAAAERALKVSGLPTPLWSIADEPSSLRTAAEELGLLKDAILIQAPDAKISGQLNNTRDRAVVNLFNTVLVNDGYGVARAEFARLKSMQVSPWLYNMPDMEAAAGFMLWRTGAEGYLQWHARAATADPSDPTDGREPDFMYLPLTADRCQKVPTIDALVIAMADGIQDLRWLQWLDGRAAGDPKARALRDALTGALPGDWTAFERAKPSLPALRGQILDYAQGLPPE